MKKLMSKLITSVAVLLIGMYVSPAFGNGTVKKSECAPKHHKHHAKLHPHYPPELCEECCIESPCPTAVLPCNDLYYPPCGFYAGGQAGYNFLRAKFRNFLNSTLIEDRGLKSDNGLIGEILGGFRFFWQSGVNLGVEVAANIEDNDLKRHLFPGLLLDVKFKRRFSIVPAIVIGRVFECRWNFFAKVGLGISRFETKIHVPFSSEHFKEHKTKLGVVPSMGMEYAINRNLSAIATLTYEYYERVGTHFTSVLVPGDNDANTVRRIQYVSAKAGFISKF